MNKSDWQKLDEILAAASEMDTAGQHSFLNRSCGGDDLMRRRAEEILAAARRADEEGFLTGNIFDAGVTVKNAGQRRGHIGKYKIVREIGRGGMGAVYQAEREGADFSQTVAVKIIKRGMDTDEIIRRFRRERQFLAALNHPNIARLIDGGTTEEDDLPFLVMEYVDGVPVTEFCDRQKLGIEERLRLFSQICSAVAYAHRHLIVHRDLKPWNILVTPDGVPKLLDFGIAKLLAADQYGEQTRDLTAPEARLFTLEYSSPEQIRGEKISTASDVYSLGVLLYELVCGHRPLRLKNRKPTEILKIISEQEPQSPSTAAGMTQEVEGGETKTILSPETVAELRGERPARLQRKLFGDLDKIVLHALRKEPGRRYATVEQFSEDVGRYLSGLPVLARPATFGYTASKFVRRNRAAVCLAAVALLAIFAGSSVSFWQAAKAERARATADLEREKAERRSSDLRRLANALLSDFDAEIKKLSGNHEARIKLARISSGYLSGLAKETPDDPVLLKELALAYVRLGDEFAWHLKFTDEARASLARAVELSRRAETLAGDVDSKNTLAWCVEKYIEFFGRENADLMLQLSAERAALREEILRAQPDEIKSYNEAANALWSHGYVLRLLDRRPEAVDYFRRVVEIRRRQIARLEESPDATREQHSLSFAYMSVGMLQTGELEEKESGIENLRRALSIALRARGQNPGDKRIAMQIIQTYLELGHALRAKGDFSAALEIYQEGLRLARPDNFPAQDLPWKIDRETILLIGSAICLSETGAKSEALGNIREAFKLRREFAAKQADASKNVFALGSTLFYGGKALALMGEGEKARSAFLEIEAAQNNYLAKADADKIRFRSERANLYLALGDLIAGCPPDKNAPDLSPKNQSAAGACISGKKRRSLEEARRWYEKAFDTLAPFEKNAAHPEDHENLRKASERLSFINSFLARAL